MEALTIVIPAYNESASISDVLQTLREGLNDCLHEVIVVNDCSTDNTAEIASTAGATVISHSRNLGYGAALKSGIRAAQTTFVLTMDADGQHRCEDVAAIWNARASNDMVVGARQGLVHSKLWRMPGKWVLWAMANFLTQRRIPDLNSGLRLFRREVILRYFHLCPSGFSFSTTSTMIMLNRGYSVEFIPIKIRHRQGNASMVKIKTGLDTVILILRLATLFNPLRIFLPASAFMVILGVGWGVPMILSRQGVSVGAMLGVVTGLLLFSIGLLSDQISQMRLATFEAPPSSDEARKSSIR